MTEPVIGQRWISENETELGLGIVVDVDARSVTLLFPASDESRVYALKNAPISRIRFDEGDTVESADGDVLTVSRVDEKRSILTYVGTFQDGREGSLGEARLNHAFNLSRPQDRLLAGQIENNEWFNLRYDTLVQMNKLQTSDIWGLAGPRLGMIPHQFYIASEVGRRHAPRVLLADEVGLGKTIEAGLIIHQQLLSERIKRVLIIVPEALQHQWLVELMRRFNLRFSLFDEDRCDAIEETEAEEGVTVNPFLTEQCVIASLDFLVALKERAAQAVEAGWDLIVVDEAHHLEWEAENPSPEYSVVEAFTRSTPGVLLLTATPEQLGVHSHFARLRLLDEKRFHDFSAFQQQEAGYRDIAGLAAQLQGAGALPSESVGKLQQLVTDVDIDAIQSGTADAREAALRALLDRHGTGRVLFRNTREVIKGFPARKLNAWPLALPAEVARAIKADGDSVGAQLYPERCTVMDEEWVRDDARVAWLVKLLKDLKREKVLLICHHAETAQELESYLRLNEGFRTSMFHEDMSILERDRAAAYFADMEAGAQILLCSEIGSEGRNFQFAHHLVLLDLPPDADLLEQRIGRLDRIGQKHEIQIHVPYYENTAQEVLMRWYHEGLNAFEKTCPAAQALQMEFRTRLIQQLKEHDATAWQLLVKDARAALEATNAKLQAGRDRLLEMNSFRPEVAEKLINAVQEQEEDTSLVSYMQRIWSSFGVDEEDHADEHTVIIRPGDHMVGERFPELDEDGLTVCFDREVSLSREDVAFLTWEHPMVRAVMDILIRGENGNANVALIRNKGVKPGTVLLEALFRIETVAPRAYDLGHYLKQSFVRVLVDGDCRNLTSAVGHDVLRKQLQALDRNTSRAVIKSQDDVIRKMVHAAEAVAGKALAPLIEEAIGNFVTIQSAEAARLRALQSVNPLVRDDEIEWLDERCRRGEEYLGSARLMLDGVRLVVAA